MDGPPADELVLEQTEQQFQLRTSEIGSKPPLYQPGSFIGRGQTANIRVVIQNNIPRVLKTVSIRGQNTENLKKEIDILKTLSSPFVVKIYDGWVERNFIQMIIEFFGDNAKDMRKVIESWNENEPGQAMKTQTLHWLYSGIKYIHSKGVVHCDIKPDNIMLIQTKEGLLFPKLIDFGYATTLQELEAGTKMKGFTPNYLYHGSLYINQPAILMYTDFWAFMITSFIFLFIDFDVNFVSCMQNKDKHLFNLRKCLALQKVIPLKNYLGNYVGNICDETLRDNFESIVNLYMNDDQIVSRLSP